MNKNIKYIISIIVLSMLSGISLSSCSNDDEPDASVFIDNLLNPKEDIAYLHRRTEQITGDIYYTSPNTPHTLACHDGKLYRLTDISDVPNDLYYQRIKPWPWIFYVSEVQYIVPFFLSEGIKKTGDKTFTINNHSFKLINCYNTRFTVEVSPDIKSIFHITYEKQPLSKISTNSGYYFDDMKSIWKKQIEIMRNHWGDEVTLTSKDLNGNPIDITYNFDELEQEYCQ